MSDLSKIEASKLEHLLGMKEGYVFRFSNKQFEDFVLDSIGVDVCDEKYSRIGTSKANRLRSLWEQESNQSIGNLLLDLFEHRKAHKLINALTEKNVSEELISDCYQIAERLAGRWRYADQSVVVSHHFEGIQNQIIEQIESARFTIWIAVAWFTDKVIFKKLVAKKNQGVNVQLIIIDDEINATSRLNYEDEFETYKIPKSGKYENMMHSKFCIIDLSTVIHGSYNWTNKAKYNHETFEIIQSREIAEQFAEQFIKLKLLVDS